MMKNLTLVFIGLLFLGCSQIKEQHEEMVYAAGVARYEGPTDPHESSAYNLSVGHWETDTLRYVIQDYPDRLIANHDKFTRKGFQDTIQMSLSLWTEHTGKIFKRVDHGDHEIFITIRKGDGLGGELARAWFPPLPNSIVKSVELRFDYWDVATLEGRSAIDFFQLYFMREDTTSVCGIAIKNRQYYIGPTNANESSTLMTYLPPG